MTIAASNPAADFTINRDASALIAWDAVNSVFRKVACDANGDFNINAITTPVADSAATIAITTNTGVQAVTALNGIDVLTVYLSSVGTGGVVVFEGSVDGTNYVGLIGLNMTSGIYGIIGASAAGTFQFNIAGMQAVRVRATALSSGTIAGAMRVSAGGTNPGINGQVYVSTAPTLTNGQFYGPRCDATGALITNPGIPSTAPTQVTKAVAVTSGQLLAANANRATLIIQNQDGANPVFILFGAGTATADSNCLKIAAGTTWTAPSGWVPNTAINAISTGGTVNCNVIEG